MTHLRTILAAAILLGTAFAAMVLPSENRLLHSVLTVIAAGPVLAFAWHYNRYPRSMWLVVALASTAASVALFYYNAQLERSCTAINAAGQRVVVGTELTDWGKRYVAQSPDDGNNGILEALGRLSPETAWTPASIERCHLRLLLSGVLRLPFLGAALACSLAFIRPQSVPPVVRTRKNVFLSYNHQDAAVALKVRDALVKHGLDVTIDVDNMSAGERIYDFIERSIRASDAVVSIVSSNSLLSSWVAVETISACQRQKWVEGKLLAGALLDQDLFNPDFRLKCTSEIDNRLEKIEKTIAEYRDQKIDSVDLNDEKTRLFDLRNALGSILATLRGSLCVDLRDEHFAESCRKLASTIKAQPARTHAAV